MANQKISELTPKATPIDADSVALYDSAGSASKQTLWSAVKATLKTYFDTLYTKDAKATGAEITTATDDAKFATAKAIKDSHNVPSVAPGTDGYVLTSNGTDWVSEASAGGGGGITVETKTDNYSVEIADSGKLLVMNSADDKIFSLPSVAAGDIGTRFYFSKIGVGKVTIDAADSDKISDSGAGDTIYNDQTLEVYATIYLILVSATQWAIIGADGIWVTTD